MRCFIAIDIGDEVRNRLEFTARDFKRFGADIRWVKSGSMHLTLKFLGEIDKETAEEVKKVLTAVAEEHGRFSINVKGTGAFPGYSRPRVLWVGVEAPERLKLIFKEIEEGLGMLGFKEDRRAFRPHLTLGRVRTQEGMRPVLSELRKQEDNFFGSINAASIDLMKSVLKPTGAVYKRLFSAKFK